MDGQAGAERLDAARLGAELGERATRVQFSTAFCQPCRATRRTLAEVAGMVEGVAHVEIDAEARLALVATSASAGPRPSWSSTPTAGSSAVPRGSPAPSTSSPRSAGRYDGP